MQIGPYQLPNNLVLAPMAGVTDKPFRQLCRRLGAGLVVSEMISADPTLRQSRKSQLRRDHQGEAAPISVQIAGADPHWLAAAAIYNVQHGAQIIDINMGCPAKKVCRKAAGSALLRDEALVAEILQAVVKAVEVPVSLKIRTGWSETERNACRIARIAEDSGIAALSIHGRTRACKFQGEAEYDTIAAVKQSVTIPVIANGDITTPEKAAAVLRHTQADGLMIGRAAQGNPWIFQQIQHFLQQGEPAPAPSLSEVQHVLLEHLHALAAFYGDYMGPRIARKHVGWYLQHQAQLPGFRQHFNALTSTAEQVKALTDYFEQQHSVAA